MKVTWFLRKNNKTKDGIINLQILTSEGSLRMSTGEKINYADWGIGRPKQKVINKAIEKTLNVLKANIEHFITSVEAKNKRKPTKYELQTEIGRLLGDEKSDLIKDIVDEYIADFKKSLAIKTIQNKTHHLKHFKSYIGYKSLRDLNKKTISGYQKHVEKLDYEVGTINDYLKTTISFLKWLYDNDITQVNFSKYISKIKSKGKPIIALTPEEIFFVQNAVMNSSKLQRVLDLFNFGLMCGLRFCDLQKLGPHHIQNGRIILRMGKTGAEVKLKITAPMKLILDKYENVLPQISNQKANLYLREIFTKLDLTRKVVISIEKIDGIIDTIEQLNNVISFHKARKTFITNALRQGIPESIVKQLSGHKSDEAFKKYIGYVNEDLDDAMDMLSKHNPYLRVAK